MTSPSTESKPVPERLFPQTSIRFFMFAIGVCAIVMYTFRAAFVDDQHWAKIASLVISTACGCFVAYAVLFFVANVFTLTTAPFRQGSRSSPTDRKPFAGRASLTDTESTSPDAAVPRSTGPDYSTGPGSASGAT